MARFRSPHVEALLADDVHVIILITHGGHALLDSRLWRDRGATRDRRGVPWNPLET